MTNGHCTAGPSGNLSLGVHFLNAQVDGVHHISRTPLHCVRNRDGDFAINGKFIGRHRGIVPRARKYLRRDCRSRLNGKHNRPGEPRIDTVYLDETAPIYCMRLYLLLTGDRFDRVDNVNLPSVWGTIPSCHQEAAHELIFYLPASKVSCHFLRSPAVVIQPTTFLSLPLVRTTFGPHTRVWRDPGLSKTVWDER